MFNKRNLFSFATKELSQDAFLMWLINNFDSDYEDVRIASKALLKTFIENKSKDDINITKLSTEAQKNKIDILVDCVIDNKPYIIAIEDKTTSFEHDNQIHRYKEYVKKTYPNHNRKYIFYKTHLLTDDEKANIRKHKWKIYDINAIYNIFESLDAKLKNNILIDYVEHIKELKEDLNGTLFDDISKWNDNNWVNFCVNHKPDVPENIVFGFGNYHNQYIYLVFMLNKPDKGWGKTIYPYGEIRSRDISSEKYRNKFFLRILIYGIEQDILDKHLEEWKKKFGNSEYFLSQKKTKQIALSKNLEDISSVSELKLLLEKYMEIYRDIML